MYIFKLPYPPYTIELSHDEFTIFNRYAIGKLGITKFRKVAFEILKQHGVSRGRLLSAAMYIVQCIRNLDYTLTEIPEKIPSWIEEEKIKKEIEKYEELEKKTKTVCEVEYYWVAHLRYCPSEEGKEKGHDIDIEIEVFGYFNIDKELWTDCMGGIIDLLNNHLFDSITYFLLTNYVLVYDEKYSGHGFSDVQVTECIDYELPTEEKLYEDKLNDYGVYSATIRRANECFGSMKILHYLDRGLEDAVLDAMSNFIDDLNKGDFDCYKTPESLI